MTVTGLKRSQIAPEKARKRQTALMQLTFLGTRGEIKVQSRLHWRHSALLVEKDDARIMIDCGADWLHHLRAVAPTAIVLTHAHADHAAGLIYGAPCPVYATSETWGRLGHLPIDSRCILPLRSVVRIGSVRFRAFPVQHSVRAPAVGYRISADRRCFFYLPDVADLPKPSEALRRIDIYIGDGATVKRSMVRMTGGALIGHAPIVRQLKWCAEAHVRRAIFTHCGSAIVRSTANAVDALVKDLGRRQGIDARIARDGDRVSLSSAIRRC